MSELQYKLTIDLPRKLSSRELQLFMEEIQMVIADYYIDGVVWRNFPINVSENYQSISIILEDSNKKTNKELSKTILKRVNEMNKIYNKSVFEKIKRIVNIF